MATSVQRRRSSDPIDRLAYDIDGAIKLREQLFQRDIDREFEKSGTIFYALDPAILNSHFRTPGGPAKSGDPATIRVFAGPPAAKHPISETRTFEIINTYLVNSLPVLVPEGRPSILLPGHAVEGRQLFRRLISQVGDSNEQREIAKKRLFRLLRRLSEALPQHQFAMLQDHDTELHGLLYEVHESLDQLRRFNLLIAGGKLRTARQLQYDHRWKSKTASVPEVAGILADDPLDPSESEDEGSVKWWQDRLSLPANYLEKDALALSSLLSLNKLLRPIDVRVVLITNNDPIVQQGHHYRPFKGIDADLSAYTFSDLFIRAPKAMLFEPEILMPASRGETFDSAGWLSAFLDVVIEADCRDVLSFREARPDVGDWEAIKKIAASVLAERPEIHAKLFEDWSNHLDKITTAHISTSEEALRARLRQLGIEKNSRIPRMYELERKIDELTEESWNDFFLTAARYGYEMIGLAADKIEDRKRNVPVIFLRDMAPAERFVDLIFKTDGLIQNESEIRNVLAALDKENTRTSRYLSAICYALLFAFADRWPVAKTLARRAIEISREPVPHDGPDKVTGREAYYFACVSHRLTARDKQDLQECSWLLQKAREKLLDDLRREAGESPAPSYPRMTGLRFEAEEIAIDTSRSLFEGMRAHWKLAGRDEIVTRSRAAIGRAWYQLGSGTDCEAETVRQTALLNLRTYIFSNLFILECAGAVTADDMHGLSKIVRDQLSDLGFDKLKADTEFRLSAVDRQSLIYGGMLAVSGGDPKLFDLLPSESSVEENVFLMPYDRSRYLKMSLFNSSRVIES